MKVGITSGGRNRNPWRLLALGTAALLTGCTMIPRYERPAAPVAPQFPSEALTNASLPAAELAWTNFVADERLKRLIGLALANNRDLRVAILNVERSRAQYRITRSATFPRLEARGSYTRTETADLTAEAWSASFGQTGYEIDFWGRVRSLKAQALEKFLATTEARRSAQVTIVAEVASQYFTLRQAEEQIQLASQTQKAVEEAYTINRATLDAGAGNELDLRTAEGQVLTAKLNVLTYERARAQAENALTLLIGQPLPADLPASLPFDDPHLLADIPAGLPSELVLRRPDILEAEHTLKAANANIGAARAAFFPAIQFTDSVGTTSREFTKLFGSGTGLWTFAPQITLPIFTGGRNRADLDAARITMRIEVANYEKAIQTAFREVADALVAGTSYTRQLEVETARIEAQRVRHELATARYRQGTDAYLNVLSAQQELYSAQQGRLQAQFGRLASQIALYRALGGGWK